MSGSATPQTQTQQTNQNQSFNSNTGPAPFIQPALEKAFNAYSNWWADPSSQKAPEFFPGTTVAQPNQQTQAVWQQMINRGRNGMDTGQYLDVGKNPYLQGALKAGFSTQNDNFNNNILPNIRSQFEGSGRNLGGADMSTSLRALKDLDTTQANAAAGAEAGAYEHALGMLPSLNAMDWQNLTGAAQGAGNFQNASQAQLDDQIARYKYNTTAQPDWYMRQIAGLLGYPGGSSSGTSQGSGTSFGTMTPASNGTSDIMGGVMGGAGLLMKLLPMLPSDERLKEDIKPVGKLHDGQTIYSYRFLGSPRTEIGLLAQEVEKRDPGAVATHPSGYKMVDYGRATAPAGGLM